MRVLFKAFDSKMASREKLFKHAAEYANLIGREDLITMSHSEDRDNIVITIWYWGEENDMQNLTRKAAQAAQGVKPGPTLAPAEKAGGLTGLEKELTAASEKAAPAPVTADAVAEKETPEPATPPVPAPEAAPAPSIPGATSSRPRVSWSAAPPE